MMEGREQHRMINKEEVKDNKKRTVEDKGERKTNPADKYGIGKR